MKKRITRRQLLGSAGGVLLGGAIGMAGAHVGFTAVPELGLTGTQGLIVILLLPLLWLAVVAVHELGHLLGGRLGGFRTLLFIAGPLRVERTLDGFRTGLNRSVAVAGGLVAMMPVGLDDLRRRTFVMVAGGPLLSLIFGSQALALHQATSSFTFSPGSGFPAQLIGIVLLALGLLSLLIGVATLVPARSGGFYSDGARMLRLRRATEETEREVALLALVGLSMGGSRPRDWDPVLVSSCAAIADGGPFEVGGRQFAYAHALDRGDIDDARIHLEAALTRIDELPAASRAGLLYAATTFYALYDADADRARQYLQQARTGLLAAPHQRLLAEAAVRLADGDADGARESARMVETMAASALDRGGAALDMSLAGQILAMSDGLREAS